MTITQEYLARSGNWVAIDGDTVISPRGGDGDPVDPVDPGGSITTTGLTSVTRNGITWTFNGTYQVGQYINGDYFVVGNPSVVFTSITPQTGTVTTAAGSEEVHGSMLDPDPLGASNGKQGYHQNGPDFDTSLNVAKTMPLTVTASSTPKSLCSTEGQTDSTYYNSAAGQYRPCLSRAAVLTIVDAAPPAGSFRPPYIAGQKLAYNESDINWSALPSTPLSPTPSGSEPSLADVQARFEPVWLDHHAKTSGNMDWRRLSHMAAIEDRPDYGRNVSAEVNRHILRLLMDNTATEKRDAMVAALQVGIDYWGCIRAGVRYVQESGGQGGHACGRKAPVMFAGAMLGDADMQTAVSGRSNRATHGEDNTTYVDDGSDSTVPSALTGEAVWASSVYFTNNPEGEWNSSYRVCCTSNAWSGSALMCYAMGLVDKWNWQPFFDYVDYYMRDEDTVSGGHSGPGSYNWSADQWSGHMWVENRPTFGGY